MSTTITTTFPTITPQATDLLMSEAEILENIEQDDLYTADELIEHLLTCPNTLFGIIYLKDASRVTPTPEEQLRSLQTCRHAYHLHKIDLFNMRHWACETECGTSMCISGSASALYAKLLTTKDSINDSRLYYPSVPGEQIIGRVWEYIFHQNNEVGLEAIKFVLNKAEQRGFLSVN